MKRVLITGATGFVGKNLLSVPTQWRTRAALRETESKLATPCESVVVGNINPQTVWDLAVRDVDCVIHMAGLAHVMNPTADDRRRYEEINVLGTEHLAKSAANQGVKRFIFLSSVKVNGEATLDRPYTSADAGAPLDDYGRSKLRAEQRLFDVAQRSNMEVIVIRPPLVYGPGVRANFLRLMSWVHKGIPLPFGMIRNGRSLVSVWNLCDLIKTAVDTTSVSSGVLMVSDDHDLSTPELIRRLASAFARPSFVLPVPESILRLAAAMTGKNAEVARLCGSLIVDITETKRKLGWRPPVSVDEGLARTARWYMSEGGAGDH